MSVGGTEVVVREGGLVSSGTGSAKLIKREELGGVFVNTNNALGLREDPRVTSALLAMARPLTADRSLRGPAEQMPERVSDPQPFLRPQQHPARTSVSDRDEQNLAALFFNRIN